MVYFWELVYDFEIKFCVLELILDGVENSNFFSAVDFAEIGLRLRIGLWVVGLDGS